MDRNDPDRYGLPRISPAEGSLPSRNTGQIQIRSDTARAPPYAGKELRLSRLGAFDAALAAIRADAARKAGDHDRAVRHETLAASYRALRDHYQQREHDLTQDMAARQEWEQATERSRRLAIAADAELRRRHPGQKIEPLRSAEPGVERYRMRPLASSCGWQAHRPSGLDPRPSHAA